MNVDEVIIILPFNYNHLNPRKFLDENAKYSNIYKKMVAPHEQIKLSTNPEKMIFKIV